jgi:drug/metabolite transporter (DMT)-like permease
VRLRGAARSVSLYGLVAVALCQLAYFNAVKHISVATALLIEYSGILFVVLYLWLRQGQRPRRLTGLGALAALAGLVLVLDLIKDHSVDPVGLLWAFGAAAGLAVYFVISARTDDGLPPIVVAWGGMTVGGVALLVLGAAGAWPLAAPRVDVTLLHTSMSWLVPVLGLSLVSAVIAYVTGIAAARRLGAKVASFTGLLEVLFAVTFAWIALGQSLDAWQLGGAALVVVGITLVRIDEMRGASEVPHEVLGRRRGPLIVSRCLAPRLRTRPSARTRALTLTPDPTPPTQERVPAGR